MAEFERHSQEMATEQKSVTGTTIIFCLGLIHAVICLVLGITVLSKQPLLEQGMLLIFLNIIPASIVGYCMYTQRQVLRSIWNKSNLIVEEERRKGVLIVQIKAKLDYHEWCIAKLDTFLANAHESEEFEVLEPDEINQIISEYHRDMREQRISSISGRLTRLLGQKSHDTHQLRVSHKTKLIKGQLTTMEEITSHYHSMSMILRELERELEINQNDFSE